MANDFGSRYHRHKSESDLVIRGLIDDSGSEGDDVKLKNRAVSYQWSSSEDGLTSLPHHARKRRKKRAASFYVHGASEPVKLAVNLQRRQSFLERAKTRLFSASSETKIEPETNVDDEDMTDDEFAYYRFNDSAGNCCGSQKTSKVVPGIVSHKRKISRRSSFLESKPIRTLTKLTRR